MELNFGSLAALVLVTSLGGGAAGAWLISSTKESPTRPTKEMVKKTSEEEADPAEARDPSDARLRSLEHRVTLLTSALSKLATPAAPGKSDGTLLPTNADDVADPVFEAAVLDILDRQQEQRETEKEERRTQRAAQENDRKIALFTERLGLSPSQVERVRQTMTNYQKQMTDLRNASPENRPNSRSAWRSKMSEFSSSIMTDLSRILSADQLKLYQDLDPDDQIATTRNRGRTTENSNTNGNVDDRGNTNSNRNGTNRNSGNAVKGESEPAVVQTNR